MSSTEETTRIIDLFELFSFPTNKVFLKKRGIHFFYSSSIYPRWESRGESKPLVVSKIEKLSLMNNPTKLECLDLRIEEVCSYYGRFRFGPLQRGQAITVANSIRRILLSELSGVAITEVQFGNPDSMIHEFSTLPGVKESIFEILLHLKDVVISKTTPLSSEMGPQKCSFLLQGPGPVTVQAISLPSGLQFVNPNQHIATIYSENVVIPVEITIEFGQGCARVPKNQSMDSIPVESTFIPVKKVNYVIEDIEVTSSEMRKKERIIFEIWTNGSVSPQEAIHEGAQRLIELFLPLLEESPEVDPFVRFSSNLTPFESQRNEEVLPSPQKNLSAESLIPTGMLIEDLGLSVRSYNCLKKAQIHTVVDLLDYSQQHLLEIKNFGFKSAEEVVQALQTRFGIELPK
jgi:DNA-directed RNA polymerase subunit alpha